MKPGLKNAIWMAGGAAVVLAFMRIMPLIRGNDDPNAQPAFKARRVALVERMQADLAAASEAEKSAVLALTGQDASTFADHARAALARVEQYRRELEELTATGGTNTSESSFSWRTSPRSWRSFSASTTIC